MASLEAEKDALVGGPARHIPVLLKEIVNHLKPDTSSIIIDGTFGAGGYSRALLDAGAAQIIGIDRDPSAIRDGQSLVEEMKGRLILCPGRFSDIEEIGREIAPQGVDGIVLDVGVSSMQIDEAERGFSFMRDGPLDMRMEQSGPGAADYVNQLSQSDLARVIWLLGEDRKSRRIAAAICARRVEEPFTRTGDLAAVIKSAIGRATDKIHAATRTFQALRIIVNGELEELALALHGAERLLKPGGRLVMVSFHSLEDRIVKRFLQFRSRDRSGGSRHAPEEKVLPPSFNLPVRGAVSPSEDEIQNNARSRSSRLRVAVRTSSPVHPVDNSILGVPDLESIDTRETFRASID
ncbi:MAG: 16S rRNA (cytosine(1402)-N(4))-methyltransferase RsmH [Cohaesibacteraceae bacterium]|nr:16S rRNA (cytosine(1402)-N(4))-methyltransferase RsmH [Cohaesibacteraceae bacterium]MBL4875736.1 16S rRNA (cytosine(1402)-N(4))-methyltransferase RsmH [Cohaesibacteraceae bacterium]